MTPAKLRTGAVTSRKIRDGEVGESDLAKGAVGTGGLADGAVQARHLSGGVFSSGDIGLQGSAGIERWGIVTGGIGARELGVIETVRQGVTIPANTAGDGQYRIREITATRREGTQIISTGVDWDPEVGAEDEMFISQIDIDPGERGRCDGRARPRCRQNPRREGVLHPLTGSRIARFRQFVDAAKRPGPPNRSLERRLEEFAD